MSRGPSDHLASVPSTIMVAHASGVASGSPINTFLSNPASQWCWRRGAAGGLQWKSDLTDVAESFGCVDPMFDDPPTLASITASSGDLSPSELQLRHESALRAYNVRNAAFYKILKTSIRHDPVWQLLDEQHRDANFDAAGAKDGRSYYLWLLPKLDTSDMVSQSGFRAICAVKLSPTASLTALTAHCIAHHSAWRCLKTTDWLPPLHVGPPSLCAYARRSCYCADRSHGKTMQAPRHS